MLRVVIVGYGEMFTNIIAGTLDANCQIVGVLRAETVKYNPIIRKLKDIFNPSIDYNYIKSYKIPEIYVRGVNTEKFKKELEFFKQCEIRKKEKIEKLRQEKIKKEIATINNKKNIHYKKKLSNKKLPSLLERLYIKDIEKRKEKKEILTKIYTPTFTPFLRSKRKNNNIQKNQNNNNYNKTIDNYNEDNLTYNDIDTIYNDEKNYNTIIRSQRSQKLKRKVKFNMEENTQYINDNINDFDDSEKEIEENQKRTVVENALRSKLFNRVNNIKRNKSVEIRKNK